jgi:serine/threonine-protein kinase
MSPDGRYLAYQSNESGRFEIYVRPFPDVKRGKWQVSTEGGSRPVWAKNAAELFYADASQTLVAVPVETSDATFAWGKPIKLVENAADDSINLRSYDIAPDGRRFLILRDQSSGRIDTAGPQIVVVVNWLEELKMKLAGRGSATK